MICKVNEKGEVLEARAPYKPSSEIKMHMRVYERRKDAKYNKYFDIIWKELDLND